MNVFTITAGAWFESRGKCESAIHQVCEKNPEGGAIVRIDGHGIATVVDENARPSLKVIDARDLLRRASAAYEADVETIQAMFDQAEGQIVLINAAAFTGETVEKVLFQLRSIAYSSKAWPAAVGVIGRDELMEWLLEMVAKTFLVLPRRRSVAEASSYAYRLHRAAALGRYFLLSNAATGKAFKLRDRVDKWKKRIFKLDESELV